MTIQEYVEENYGEELREEGRAEGRVEGTDRVNKLNTCLVAAKRQDDMLRAMHDKEFQKRLLKEFGI